MKVCFFLLCFWIASNALAAKKCKVPSVRELAGTVAGVKKTVPPLRVTNWVEPTKPGSKKSIQKALDQFSKETNHAFLKMDRAGVSEAVYGSKLVKLTDISHPNSGIIYIAEFENGLVGIYKTNRGWDGVKSDVLDFTARELRLRLKHTDHEIMASILNDGAGFDLVPTTIPFAPGSLKQEGSLQLFVPNTVSADKLRGIPQENKIKLALFDSWILNDDRNLHNILIQRDTKKIIAIDHQ